MRRSASAYSGILREASGHGYEDGTRRNTIPSYSNDAPTRQPINPDGDFDWQKARGFARFIREHASPRHHRVTAGGRIVPALPNTPPPTFHDAFLDAFLQSGAIDPIQLASEVPQNSVTSRGNSTLPSHTYSSTTSHLPKLKIPPGFRVIQASIDGSVAITTRGTTTYRYELMANGQTNCKVVAQEAKLSVLQNPTTGTMYSTDTMHNDPSLMDQAVYGNDPMAIGLANPVGNEAPHYDTNGLQTWDHLEQELQQSFQPYNGRAVNSSYSSSRSRRQSRSIPSPPDGYTWTYQQQLASLDQAIQGWTAMLMDAERVLCFPNVLGHAGVESTRIKRQIMLVKIDELSRKKQQIEAYLASLDPASFAQAGSDDSGQASSRGLTEVEHEAYNDQQYVYYNSNIPLQNQVLSPLAPTFVPFDQRNPITQLDGVTAECRLKGGSMNTNPVQVQSKENKTDAVEAKSDVKLDKLAGGDHNEIKAPKISTYRHPIKTKLFIPGSSLKAPSTLSQPQISSKAGWRSTTI